ncbi:MAG: chemotaxis protein CheB [Candidatus Auribacterota bacterium]|jgi:two-component system chemotaxis response regulator CheB|uniref:protein-glutamate methylesterase n=1 Tax=Candidatus Auribacter fodinae TaxID=2093366 RepID=A0A3A4QU82_9BACT|nr:MAG: hypothetical protein C4541_12760 [Candidatus Auribacter fodinae]
MKRNELIIVDASQDITVEIIQYCKQQFSFKSIHQFKKVDDIAGIDLKSVIIFVNSVVLLSTDQIVSLSQCISKYNVPVIIYSVFDEDSLSHIVDALELGAIDIVPAKIFYPTHTQHADQVLFDKLITELRKGSFKFDFTLLRNRIFPESLDNTVVKSAKRSGLVVIGCDIGGSSSLLGLIPQLPKSFTIPVCILINNNAQFLDAFCDRLQLNSQSSVKRVYGKSVIEPSTIYLISANRAPVLDVDSNGIVSIISNSSYPYDLALKYSIDQFMFNAADIYGKNTIGVLLGGMQKDGILGLEQIKRVSGHTIIQSTKSCYLNDRHKFAKKTGCVESSVYLGEMAEKLVSI